MQNIARVVCVQDNEFIAGLLKGMFQFGVGVKGGIEYAYHSVRLHMLSSMDDHELRVLDQHAPHEGGTPGILKVDFKNGYNSTCRAKMLSQVQSKMPKLLRFARFLHNQQAQFVVGHA